MWLVQLTNSCVLVQFTRSISSKFCYIQHLIFHLSTAFTLSTRWFYNNISHFMYYIKLFRTLLFNAKVRNKSFDEGIQRIRQISLEISDFVVTCVKLQFRHCNISDEMSLYYLLSGIPTPSFIFYYSSVEVCINAKILKQCFNYRFSFIWATFSQEDIPMS